MAAKDHTTRHAQGSERQRRPDLRAGSASSNVTRPLLHSVPAEVSARTLDPGTVLSLQTTAGNAAVTSLLARRTVQRVQVTYDDGPDSGGQTQIAVDELTKAGARATFYVVGKRVQDGDNYKVVFNIAASGSWLGNHAFDWNDATDDHIFLAGTKDERAEKILKTETAIREALVKGKNEAMASGAWQKIDPLNRLYIDDVISSGTGRFRTPGFKSHWVTKPGSDLATQRAIDEVNEILGAAGLRRFAQSDSVNIDEKDWEKVDDGHGGKRRKTQAEVEKAYTDALKHKDNPDASLLLHSRLPASVAATPAILAAIKAKAWETSAAPRGATDDIVMKPPKHVDLLKDRSAFLAKPGSTPAEAGEAAIAILQKAQASGDPNEVNDFIRELETTPVPGAGTGPTVTDAGVEPAGSADAGTASAPPTLKEFMSPDKKFQAVFDFFQARNAPAPAPTTPPAPARAPGPTPAPTPKVPAGVQKRDDRTPIQREIIGVEADWIKGIHIVDPQDQHEFDLLKGKVATAAGEPIADLDAYLKQRRSTFGSDDAYRAYGAIADAELDADKDRPPPPKGPIKLRSMLEFGSQPETQTLYYRWVRKGYEDNAGVTGDIGAYIRRASARSDRLRSSVRDAYGGKQAWRAKGWELQGFNPRPVKTATFRYQLGTLSEHAKGSAVDIDPDHNPPLLLSQWAWIEKVTGLKVNRNAGEWDKNPQVLWESIKGLSDAFVKKVAARIAEEEETQRWWAEKVERWSSKYHLLDQPLGLSPQWTEPGLPMSAGMKRAALASRGARATAADNLQKKGAKKPEPRKQPIDIVFADQPSMKKWKDGFFALPWDLVTKLHDLQLVWGATFSSKVDLHHFELPAGVVDEEEAEVAKQAEEKRLRDATTETTPFGRGTESP